MSVIFRKCPVKSIQDNIPSFIDCLVVNIVKAVKEHFILPDEYSRQVRIAAGIFRMAVFPVRKLE